jgi:capsular polysaccharide biosynthesis protein/Mrp family chromosome partitioning ATPase
MSVSGQPDSVDLSYYPGVLRRRWRIVLVATCLGALGAIAYLVLGPKTYSASASVYVIPTAADQMQGGQVANSRTSGTVNMDSQAQLVQSGTVGAIAARRLHSSLSPWELAQQVNVRVPANSAVLQISCNTSSGAAAAACASAFAAAYLQNRSATATNMTNAALHTLQGQIKTLEGQSGKLASKISGLSAGSVGRANAQAQLRSVTSQLHALSSQAARLTAQGADSSGGSVISSPGPPHNPTSPKKPLVLASGLVAGLVIGLTCAFWWDRRGRRIYGASAIERYLSIPVLLSLYPQQSSLRPSLAPSTSTAGREFAELARNVASTPGPESHLLIVVGASPGNGASMVAANLAAMIAKAGSETVLVCPDPRSATPRLLELAEGRGLAEVLAGGATISDVARAPDGIPQLRVLTRGMAPAALYETQHDTALDLVGQLRAQARYVVVEAQAKGRGADSFALAEFADVAIVVIELAKTGQAEAADCVRRLDRLRTTVLGAAVLPATGRKVSAPRLSQQPRPARAAVPGDVTGLAPASGELSHDGAAGDDQPEFPRLAARSQEGSPGHTPEEHEHPAGRATGG